MGQNKEKLSHFNNKNKLQEKELLLPCNISADFLHMIKKLTILGKGIGLLPEFMVKDDLKFGNLQQVDFLSMYFKLTNLYVLYPSRDFVPERVRALINFIESSLN